METKITYETKEAITFLKRGELVAFPTETVYGLGGALFQEKAVAKIFSTKGRPSDNPLIAHLFSREQAFALSCDLSPLFTLLAEHFWPGPLTLVVWKNPALVTAASAGKETIALRIPSHPIALQILEGVGEPLAAPSANLSGRPSPTSARDVWEDLSGKIPLIVDGGPCTLGIESTVLSLVHRQPTILRPGTISAQDLEVVLGRSVSVAEEGAILSPGMKYRHYAPRATVRLVWQEEALQGPFILSRTPLEGKEYHPLSAQTLYHFLREADRLQVSEIEVYCDAVVREDVALMNRLLRASMQEPIHDIH